MLKYAELIEHPYPFSSRSVYVVTFTLILAFILLLAVIYRVGLNVKKLAIFRLLITILTFIIVLIIYLFFNFYEVPLFETQIIE